MSNENVFGTTLFQARRSLRELDNMTSGMAEERVLVEVAKAVTVASSHSDVEARVVVTSKTDEIIALGLLRGKIASLNNATWNAVAKELVFPNGSAVVVKLRT